MAQPESQQPALQGNFFDDHQKYLDKLDVVEVKKWTVKQVCSKFLDPLGLSPLKQIFVDHKITGHVLLTLDRRDLVEMQIHAVGDRVYIDKCLHDLRRKSRKAERERVLWEGYTPYGSVAYYENVWECMAYKCCGCLMRFTKWTLTSQGVRERRNPPSCNMCCAPMVNNFSDYRFLKDVDWRKGPMCLCCRYRMWVELAFDTSTDDVPDVPSDVKGMTSDSPYLTIAHPDMTDEFTSVIRHAWSEARLVAD